MKKLIYLWIALVLGTTLYAAPPTTYYTGANAKSSDALRLALQDIIEGHIVVSYDNLNMLYIASDSHPDGSMWDMYSTCAWQHNQKKCGNYQTVCDCYNKEHSIPQSWFGSKAPMVSDAFHVYPTDGKVNGQRSAYPFGECTGGTTLTSDALGRLGTSTFAGFSGKVFEPVDEYKGDLARTYFYMATRYANACSSWSGGMFGSNNKGFQTWAINMLLEWHRQDPVSTKEILRNEVIYGNSTYNKGNYKQNNRNPFIDYPVLAEYIWGTKTGESWYGASTPVEQVAFARLQVYPNPANEVVSITVDGVDQFAYTIFDISGQMLQSGMAQSDDLVSISQLNGGVYVLQIAANGKNQVVKLVVTK